MYLPQCNANLNLNEREREREMFREESDMQRLTECVCAQALERERDLVESPHSKFKLEQLQNRYTSV